MEFIQAVECLFSNVWMMVTSVEYPGTGIPVAAIAMGALLAIISIKIIRSSLGGGND